MSSGNRVCLVGVGVIAATHAECLAALGKLCVAIVEPNEARAIKFSTKWKIPKIYPDIDQAIKAGGFDAVHILTPPSSHFTLAKACVEAGIPVLIEKPLAETVLESQQLVEASRTRNVLAAVNQNFVFHPAFSQLRKAITSGSAGPLRSISVAYNAPLRQLAARQFGAWMFHRPGNILLEQAVHPLSQVVSLLGHIDGVSAISGPAQEIAHNIQFHSRIDAVLTSKAATAHLQFAVGASFPFWQLTAVCDDAILFADMLNNRFFRVARGAGLEPIDGPTQAIKTGAQIAFAGVRNFADYVLSLAKFKGRSDPFFASMTASIAAFHRALRGEPGEGPVTAQLGAEIVRLCEVMDKQCFVEPKTDLASVTKIASPEADVALLGGTGFIGSATVKKLTAAGLRVRVMARNTRNLSAVFHDEKVSVVAGDIGREADVRSAIAGVPIVVNLAHGGGGETWADIERALVGGARNVADACVASGVKQLIHVGSIASLYLGDSNETITCSTPPDPMSETRADYARAKANADRMLLDLSQQSKMPVCILRPGLVVGEGTSPFHSGLGMFNNDQFCIGWNDGNNSLPFVLVDDVGEAILQAVNRAGKIGNAYNIVGNVRLTARQYIHELAKVTCRPLEFCPSMVWRLYLEEAAKWLIKRAVGRAAAPPSMRDLTSRGLVAQFDCSAAEKDMGWTPVSSRETFIAQCFKGL